MKIDPEIDGLSVVLLGAFNPAIFHPLWFKKEELLPPTECANAKIEIISQEVTVFSAGWMVLEAVPDRLTITTTQSQYFETLRDLVVGMFTLLRHTPIRAMGVNRMFHFRTKSVESFQEVRHTLAPTLPWVGLLKNPGMKKLLMEGEHSDTRSGHVLVTVEPSVKVLPIGSGVYLGVTQHYEAPKEGSIPLAAELVDILKGEWKACITEAGTIAEKLLSDAV